jgi:type II secretory pathway component GspD/PulD (secretin)
MRIRILLIYATILLYAGILGVSSSPLFAQEEEPVVHEEAVEKEGKEDIKEEREEIIKAPTKPTPVLEIRRLEAEEPLYSIELRNVDLADLFRVVAHDYNLNILVDKKVKGKVTASFTNITLEEALDEIAESSNLSLVKRGNIIKVIPNLITRIFLLKYVEAKTLLESGTTTGEGTAETGTTGMTMGATGEATPPAGAETTAAADAGEAVQTTEGTKQQSTIFDLLSEDGKVLLGKQPNSLMVIDYPDNIAKIEEFINMVDRRMAFRVFKLKYLSASEIVGKAKTGGAEGEEAVGMSEETEAAGDGGGTSE